MTRRLLVNFFYGAEARRGAGLREYFPALAAAVDPSAIFSFDRVHERHLGHH